ncbi:MAG: hypothetical protein U0R80_01845 [Nocardioidaceae bacterium]
MSRTTRPLAHLAASGLVVGLLTSGLLAASSTSPAPANGVMQRQAGSVRTTTWSAAVEVDGRSGFTLKLPRVPSGDYLASVSGAIDAGVTEIECALTRSPKTRPLLVGATVPSGPGSTVHLLDATRTVHLAHRTTVFLVCLGTQVESYATVAGYPMQVSLTRVDELTRKDAHPVPGPVARSADLFPR